MRKLFLTSDGLPEGLKDIFLEFLGKDPKSMKVAFIPTAAKPEIDKSFVDRVKKELNKMGMEVFEVDFEEEDQKSLKNRLSDCDIIYVNGGNTYYLLDKVRKSGFDKIIGELLDKGKIYVGVSAGSYIACPNIEQAGWKKRDTDRNVVDLDDLTALNLVPFMITAHYNREKYRVAVVDGVAKSKYPVVALRDSQAVQVEGDKYKVVGKGRREFFNGFKEKK